MVILIKGLSIGIEFASFCLLAQVNRNDVLIINQHFKCWSGLWVEPENEEGAIVGHGILVEGDIKAKGVQEEW